MNLKKVIYQRLQRMTTDEYNKYLGEQGQVKVVFHPEDENILIVGGLIVDITNMINNDIRILAKFGKEDIVSYFYNNRIYFATRDGFETEQALKATQIWEEKYSKYVTPIYFLYTIAVQIVDSNDLTLLGLVDLRDDYVYEDVLVKAIAEQFGMPMLEQV